MRPQDHPEFFRLPPPEGRSRESSIALDAEGRFSHDGELVRHPGMARAFSSWIDLHPDNGRFILNNGYDWSYFRVEDVPFFVLGLREQDGCLLLGLSDGSESPLDPQSLTVGARGALYTMVKAGKFRARFTPAAQTALAAWLSSSENGELSLEIAGHRLERGFGRALVIEGPADESPSSGSAFRVEPRRNENPRRRGDLRARSRR
ncbi:MAG TPA: hypothetical protein VK745_28425 [Polyangiaceae bacterium]|nr:hypothetical protein [Polyangiaceae bacterium]